VSVGQVLPVEQEAHEVAQFDRLDFAPQPLDGVAMDARQQVAFAPFFFLGARREAAAHDIAFGFQLRRGRSLAVVSGRPARRRSRRGAAARSRSGARA
jgi:hypothetical protein